MNIDQWPSIFRNTKEIPKNTKENLYRFCFGHNFFTNAAINLIPWQVIFIFIDLSMDTVLGHFHGHLWSGHNGHYGPYLKMAALAYGLMAIIMAKLGVYWKKYENVDHLSWNKINSCISENLLLFAGGAPENALLFAGGGPEN